MKELVLFLSFCHCMSLLWGQTTDSPTPVTSTTAIPSTATPTVPPNVANVSLKYRTETTLTFEWNKGENYNYTLSYETNSINIDESTLQNPIVTATVSSLTPGTEYSFTLYTVRDQIKSPGFNFSEVTVPSNAVNVTIKDRNETALVLEWSKVSNNNGYNYCLSYNDNKGCINGSDEDSVVTYTVSPLTAGTEYNFILYTIFKEVQSTGFNFSSITVPSNAAHVTVKERNETALTFEWEKVSKNNYNYCLSYDDDDDGKVCISGPAEGSVVNHTVSSLTPGTEYNFTLYTVFKDVESTGFSFTNVTTPPSVNSVDTVARNETAVTLQWNKVNNRNEYVYRLRNDTENSTVYGSMNSNLITYTVSSLSAGNKYTFTLYTVFKDVESTGYPFAIVTVPLSVTSVSVKDRSEKTITFEWFKVKNNSNYSLSYNGNQKFINGSVEDSVVTDTVSSLTPGTEYNFTLYTVFENVQSRGLQFTQVTIPVIVSGLKCKYSHGGYGLTLIWSPPIEGHRTAVEVNITGKSFLASGETKSIEGLQPAQWYTLTVASLFSSMSSAPITINCQTDPRGIIAGVLVFLLLVVIICIGIYIWRHKPKLHSILSKSKSQAETKQTTDDKYKPVPLKMFPDHFSYMSRDENRAFSEEYEDLRTVGTDQSSSASLLPENKSKNRFTNVLAYDSSRVKLTVQSTADSEYINANYMPGYGSNKKQYIAAQGPLPLTVNDFWRMVWEQKSPAIVMLTNCVESGRVKCEQYWPLDYTPHTYGNLTVTVQLEQKDRSWTRREFLIRNKETFEERTVTHFHFTAWPDHGVPKGTEELIDFRGIVREHIKEFPFTGPTIVHCSAGVGRTGTLIALDTLLQEMEKENAVGIAACVHRMRLNRPLMVQTESQYVFLHQCILDSLQPKEDPTSTDPIYENSDMIYANTVALNQYKTANSSV